MKKGRGGELLSKNHLFFQIELYKIDIKPGIDHAVR